MIRLKIPDNFEQILGSMPGGWVFYVLKSPGEYLYAGISTHLGARLRSFWQMREDKPVLKEIFSQTEYLEYQIMPDSISSLIMLKCFVAEHAPIYQNRLCSHENYVYLALNSHRFPFIRIQAHTGDDWTYLGPFRSRFYLADLLDSLSRILKLPNCETGTYPCDKFERGTCQGWCLALSPPRDIPPAHNLERLETLLLETFTRPQNSILGLIKQERDKYFDELDFLKADLLDDEIRLQAKYQDWLKFLHVSRSLELENDSISIEHGQLSRSVLADKEYFFPIDKSKPEENEELALPLTAVDEMKIIYDYIKELSNAW